VHYGVGDENSAEVVWDETRLLPAAVGHRGTGQAFVEQPTHCWCPDWPIFTAVAALEQQRHRRVPHTLVVVVGGHQWDGAAVAADPADDRAEPSASSGLITAGVRCLFWMGPPVTKVRPGEAQPGERAVPLTVTLAAAPARRPLPPPLPRPSSAHDDHVDVWYTLAGSLPDDHALRFRDIKRFEITESGPHAITCRVKAQGHEVYEVFHSLFEP
jgi:hypothetical protein